MKAMRSLIAILIGAAVMLAAYHFYFARSQSTGTASAPTQVILIAGVKNDLIAIAQAERAYFADHGAYAALDDLISSGALAMARPGRDGYTYTIEVTASGFIVTAHYAGSDGLHHPTIAVDQNMQIRFRQ